MTAKRTQVAADRATMAGLAWLAWALLIVLLLCALVAGCSGRAHARADAALARESLQMALEAWKKGEPARALSDHTPSIVAQDMEWEAGARLVDYQIAGDGRAIESNLHVPVTLSLQTPQGRTIERKVTYVVGTSPSITVFRALH